MMSDDEMALLPREPDEARGLRMALADVVLAAVLHPEWPERFEIVPRQVVDRARMMLDQSDINAAAERARAARAALGEG